MEIYFKNTSDITYKSELTPAVLFRFAQQNETAGVKFAQIGNRYYGRTPYVVNTSASRVLI